MEISKSAIDDLRDFMKSTFSNVAQTVDGLKQAVKKHNGRFAHYGDRKFVQDKMNEMEAKNGGNENAWIYSTDVINDLNKIKFGKSNIDSGWGELDAPGFRPGFDELDEENGLTVVWAAACSSGEWPVAFAVYVDNHKHLRAYIPEKGNVFDAKNKCALMKGTPQTYNMEAMRAQAKARIMVDESTKPKEEEKEDSTVKQNTSSSASVATSSSTPSPVHQKPIAAGSNQNNTATKDDAWEFIEAIRELNGKDDNDKNGHHWISKLPEFVNSNLFTPISIKTALTIYFNTESWIGFGGYDNVDEDGMNYGNVSDIQKYFGPIIAGPEKLSNGSIIVWGSIILKDNNNHNYCPFAFILYLDNQKTLHAYIPSAGNFYDHKTNLPYISKNKYYHGKNVVFDIDAMRNEFLANVTNLRISPPKPIKKVNPNNPFDLLTLDWTTIPNLTDGMEKYHIDDLDDFQKSWRDSPNPFADEAATKSNKWLCNPKDINQWTSFQKGIEDAAGGYDWWVNPVYANLNPSTIKVGQKEVVSCGGADYLIDFFFDQSNGTLIGYIFDVD